MIINNFKKTKIKILLDTEDLKNCNISLDQWIQSPKNNLKKLFHNFPEYKESTPKEIHIYSYKFILFYIFIEY